MRVLLVDWHGSYFSRMDPEKIHTTSEVITTDKQHARNFHSTEGAQAMLEFLAERRAKEFQIEVTE